MSPNEKILDKLGKIKAHMESAAEIGNVAEAQVFGVMLQNLLAKHKLEMTDITYNCHKLGRAATLGRAVANREAANRARAVETCPTVAPWVAEMFAKAHVPRYQYRVRGED